MPKPQWKPGLPPDVVAWLDKGYADGLFYDQVFTHIERDTGVVRNFNATKMLIGIAERRVRYRSRIVHITRYDYDMIMSRHGIEELRVQHLREQDLLIPPLFLIFNEPDGEHHVLCDGNHRIVRHYREGRYRIPCLFLTEKSWKPYCFDVPPMIQHMFEGKVTNGQQSEEEIRSAPQPRTILHR